MRRLIRLFYTLRPLRWQQWWYRGLHPVLKYVSRPAVQVPPVQPARLPDLHTWPVAGRYHPQGQLFTFLNRDVRFGDRILWEYTAEGPLWRFNLHYFEWLYDETVNVADRQQTVAAFCRDTAPGASMHGYPTSLRIMAWIWFDLKHGALNGPERARLYRDADWLRRFPEYQLDGNHLFENAIALCTAGRYFNDARLQGSGGALLKRCISDQLCNDGGHCEGSPMYHSLLLWRLLQALELHAATDAASEITAVLRNAAVRMLGWLKAVTFSDGTWPAVNDAVAGVAPEPAVLFAAAGALGLSIPETRLGDSGYRMIRMSEFELFIDADGIRPSWQPGHAHADTGSFCLHVRGQAVIVDTGCSTYEDPAVRRAQRGTAAHNTVRINGRDSSELWSRFRAGRRCRVLAVRENGQRIHIIYQDAWHNRHSREFIWTADAITIRDCIGATGKNVQSAVHLAPGLRPDAFKIDGLIELQVDGADNVVTKAAEIAAGFNILLPSACLLLTGRENDLVLTIRHILK